MNGDAQKKLIKLLNDDAIPLLSSRDKYSVLIDNIGDARFVMIGEASHGTHEFYQTRLEITQQLILQKGFMAVVIEGDWPYVYRIHRYLQGQGNKLNAAQALEGFKHFPTWMWRNSTMIPFLTWLRNYNDKLSISSQKIGFYGLDLYSLSSSMQAVIDYLLKVDPKTAELARKHYSCFDHLNSEPQNYGYLASAGVKKSCIEEAVKALIELQRHAIEYVHQDGYTADEYFYAVQNARLVKNAESYYRSVFSSRVSSWNIRDRHMTETINAVADHLGNRFQKRAKIIIWAHNSHVGDARATEMGEKGEVNIGQLIREQHDKDTYSLGFSTFSGFVTAASDWGNPPERMRVNPGLKGSYEELFHQVKYNNFILNLIGNQQLEHYLQPQRLQRAIGVIYRPEAERYSHYFFTHLPYQFDSLIHHDQTTAVEPLNNFKS